ncbi:MAG: leucine-rich repeat domain-containing protein [Holosporales bacterium]|jgi:hypothetical protein|nr:leucine-rich repeat domain-containing protein [Holosporales bacterium]
MEKLLNGALLLANCTVCVVDVCGAQLGFFGVFSRSPRAGARVCNSEFSKIVLGQGPLSDAQKQAYCIEVEAMPGLEPELEPEPEPEPEPRTKTCPPPPSPLPPPPLQAIPPNFFAGCNIKKVIIGAGVRTINTGAFAGCPNLRVIKIGNSVEEIEDGAFYGTSLDTLDLSRGSGLHCRWLNYEATQAFLERIFSSPHDPASGPKNGCVVIMPDQWGEKRTWMAIRNEARVTWREFECHVLFPLFSSVERFDDLSCAPFFFYVPNESRELINLQTDVGLLIAGKFPASVAEIGNGVFSAFTKYIDLSTCTALKIGEENVFLNRIFAPYDETQCVVYLPPKPKGWWEGPTPRGEWGCAGGIWKQLGPGGYYPVSGPQNLAGAERIEFDNLGEIESWDAMHWKDVKAISFNCNAATRITIDRTFCEAFPNLRVLKTPEYNETSIFNGFAGNKNIKSVVVSNLAENDMVIVDHEVDTPPIGESGDSQTSADGASPSLSPPLSTTTSDTVIVDHGVDTSPIDESRDSQTSADGASPSLSPTLSTATDDTVIVDGVDIARFIENPSISNRSTPEIPGGEPDQRSVAVNKFSYENFAPFAGSGLRKVSWRDGVTYIRRGFFAGCQFLESIAIPSSVMSIGREAFSGSNIKNVDFVAFSRLASIDEKAFAGCEKLQLIEIPASVTSIGTEAFEGSGLQCIAFEPDSSLTTIGVCAFRGCQFSSIVIPSRVSTIENTAFAGSAIEHIEFEPNSRLKSITQGMLWGCPLKSFTIPNSVTAIMNDAFINNTELEHIAFEPGSQLETITPGMFNDCCVEAFVIPKSVTVIGSRAFIDTNLGHVAFEPGSQLKEITDGMFEDCQLKSIVVPASVTKIVDRAFAETKLEHVAFEPGSKLKKITENMFNGCQLKSIIIPASVTEIANGAFAGLELKHVAFEPGSQLTTITEGMFRGCQLESIVIPKSVTTIQDAAFACTELEHVAFEHGSQLKEITEGMFRGCPLKSIVIPASVTKIAANAFIHLELLTHVAFEPGSQLQHIAHSAFAGCNLKIIELPARIRTISLDAFQKVKYITFEDTEESGGMLNPIFGGAEQVGHKSLQLIELPPAIRKDVLQDSLPTICGSDYIDFRKCNPAVYEGRPHSWLTSMLTSCNVSEADGCEALFHEKRALLSFKLCRKDTRDLQWESIQQEKDFEYDFKEAKQEIANLKNIAIAGSIAAGCNNGLAKSDVRFVLFPPRSRIDRLFDPIRRFPPTQIGNNAFKKCKNLITAIIPEYMSSIGDAAFLKSGVYSVLFEYGTKLSSIGANAFSHCANLNSITIPQSVHSIGPAIFANSRVRSVLFEAGSTLAAIPEQAFAGCSNLTSITIPRSVQNIGPAAFANSGVYSVLFEAGGILDAIPEQAFANCSNLNSITIPRSVRNIGPAAFRNSGIHSVIFENGSNLREILGHAFTDCSRLNSVTIPRSVRYIGPAAFSHSRVRSVSFEDGSMLETIDEGAFHGCSNLKSFVVPPQVRRIEAGALSSVKRLDLTHNKLAQRQDNLANFLTEWLTDCLQGCVAVSQLSRQYCIHYRDQWHELTPISRPTDLHGQDFVIILPGVNLEACNFKGVKVLVLSDDDVSAYTLSPEKLKNIRDVEYIEIPNSVERIEENTFAACINATVVIDEENHIEYVGRSAFFGCDIGDVVFHQGTEISEGAFFGAKWGTINLSEVFSREDCRGDWALRDRISSFCQVAGKPWPTCHGCKFTFGNVTVDVMYNGSVGVVFK